MMTSPDVLLVDSFRDGLELYSTALALEGISARTARSASEALSQIAGACPRVLVTELRLADQPGTELVEQVRRRCTGGIFIVGLTTNGEAEGPLAQAAGCDVVLPLPCLPETLIGELRRALD